MPDEKRFCPGKFAPVLKIQGNFSHLRANPAHLVGHLPERGLAGKKTLINIFQDVLTLEYGEHHLSRYSVEWQPDDKHLLRVGNPRLYDHPYQSPQLPLWEPGEVEWFVIIRNAPPVRHRRKKGRVVLIQPPMFLPGDEASG